MNRREMLKWSLLSGGAVLLSAKSNHDMGVHPNPFSVYDDIVGKLTAGGIPREQIAVIGDADSDAKKRALFDRVRSGQVRVVIGSTTKMGTGTNVQKRLKRKHDLDAPWKPAEVEQRDGRILRQGNDHDEVEITRYVTEGSFDAFMWQTLETKARFINQIMTGDATVRKAEDIGGQELSYAEVKAIASGNPAVLTLAEADAELQRLTILRRNHSDAEFLARRNIRDLPGTIERLTQRIAGLTADMETMEGHDDLVIGSRSCSRKHAAELLGGVLDTLPMKVYEKKRVPLGTYRGLHFGIVLNPQWANEVYLEGAVTRQDTLSRDSQGPRAILNAVDRIASGYGRQPLERDEQDGMGESGARRPVRPLDEDARPGAGRPADDPDRQGADGRAAVHPEVLRPERSRAAGQPRRTKPGIWHRLA